MSKTLQQKIDYFLLMHGFLIHAEVKEMMCPPWCDKGTSPYRCPDDHGQYYRVSLMRDEKTMFEFDYWDIFHGGDERPTNYEIVAHLIDYVQSSENVGKIPFGRYGVIKVELGKELRAFLTSDELDGLLNINK